MTLLDTSFLTKLERLSLIARRVRAGQAAGERRSTKRGTSVEFADYRDYTRGDDLRRVDWNIYGRLERAYVKLFEEEEDLAVHLLLDGSGSMDWGGGDGKTRGGGDRENKWVYARRLVAALGYIALTSGDRLTVATITSPEAPRAAHFGPVRGRGHALRLFDWLEGLKAGGTTDLNTSLRTYALGGGRAGLVLLISDLFSPAGYVEGLTALAARGHEVAVLHLLSPDEVAPVLGGDLRLVDVETGEPQEVTVDGGMRALYRRRLAAWQEEIRTSCRARGIHYVPLVSDTPFERVVLTDLRQVGVVR
ncbi:MAG TPA: DUF58 domain-containing protein [Anaerolineae bacterium]|nr:DUF58 domain-containing protein [Anaerolineae bacterium]